MNIFETKKVFNADLLGKAVKVWTARGKKEGIIIDVQETEIQVVGVGGHSYYGVNEVGDSVKLEFLVAESEVEKKIEIAPASVGKKHVRTNKQIENENRILTEIFKEHGGEMHISQVVERMLKAGFGHWAYCNPSAHLITAKEWGQPIARVRKGYYKYVGEVL